MNTTGSWITPGAQTGNSNTLYVHERVVLSARGPVNVDSSHIAAIIALPNGGSTTLRGRNEAAPEYWQTDLYGQPVYGAPRKPSVAPNEDLGALRRVSLARGQSASYVVTFSVPIADSDGSGHVTVSSVTWIP